MVRTIEEFLKAKKRLSIEVFTLKDIEIILSTNEGFIIVNNVQIPIKNRALDLTQWISKQKPKRDPKTKEQIKADNKRRQKIRRMRKKLEMNLEITKTEINEKENLYISMPFIFRDYSGLKTLNTGIKRIITAKRIIQINKPKLAKKRCNNIPIQQLLKTLNYLKSLSMDKGSKNLKNEYKEFMAKNNRINKHYAEKELFLVSMDGIKYRYTDKGLIKV